jgi:tRNA nucleotidyltransferase (CCA-adding enzyme)
VVLSEQEREGLQGFEIAKRLHDKRIHALKHFKEQWAAEHPESK